MTLRKKILFYTLLTLFTLAAFEGMARLAYYLAFAESYSPPSISPADAADLAPDDLPGLTRRIPPPRGTARFVNKISHPYYGFTSHSPNSPLNVMPPPRTSPDTIAVALLGGSVALDVAPYLQQALTQYFADQGLAKDPLVVPLAYPAMKQPQQLHIANFILAMGGNFDILVNLDGFNELNHSYINFTKDVFPFFPYNWEKLVFLTPDEIALAGQIRAARGQLSQLQQSAPASPFRYTALYGILHRYQLQQTDTRILQLNDQLSTARSARSLGQHGPLVPFPDAAQLHQEAIRVWYRSSALLSRLAAAAGADYYHFLQPNQYIPNSKPLSPKERQKYLHPGYLKRTNYDFTYPLLQKFGTKLQQQGIHYFDLTQIFNDHPETLYRDDCCHLNPRGYEILAAAIVQRLAPALQRRAAAPSPEPDGILTVSAPSSIPPAPPDLPLLPAAAPAKPDFQVSLRPGNLLVYVKENCGPEHTAAPFFLHITPTDPADLPPDRHRYGFASQDFFFDDVGFRALSSNGWNCTVELLLPNYSIAHLRTGQYNPAGEIWSVELTFPQ